MASYLDTLAFQEPPAGPRIHDRHGHTVGRDPSPEQICRMCEAIRSTWGTTREVQALGRTVRFDRDARRHRMSEPTHIPHGITAEEIGGQRCRDMML
jgi:hypothetical protein